jgi:hypothetical protein
MSIGNGLQQFTLKKLLMRLLIILILLADGLGAFLTLPRPAQAAQPPKTIRFSHEAMVTGQPIQLTMVGLVSGVIRYTTNGSVPNAGSAVYQGAIVIDKPTVIRAQMFGPSGNPVGGLYTQSYIVAGYNPTIPVMSVTAEWAGLNNLHDNVRQRGREWEQPINVEYFAPGGKIQFNVAAGLRIHGGNSRMFSPKKSYRLYFRKEYGGPGKLDYPLFPDSTVTKFDKLVLRAGFNDSFAYRNSAGEYTTQTHSAKYIGDQVVRNLHRDMGQPVAHGNWVLLYLNGQFWGLYNLTERVDQDFLQSYSAQSAEPAQWDTIAAECGWDEANNWFCREEAKDGDYGAWLDNQNWVGSADFYNPGNIGGLEWRVDVENMFSYMFLQAYVQNYDWPGNNWIVYRRKDPGATGNEGKWRFIMWDAEYSFGSGSQGFKTDINTLERVVSPHDSITRLMEKPFIGNCGFKVRFWERGREYLGVDNPHGKPPVEIGQLSKERVKAEIVKQAEIVRPFIAMETQRWAPDLPGPQLFEQNIENALTFVEQRQDVVLHHLDNLRYQTFTQCR